MKKLLFPFLLILAILSGCQKGRMWADEDIDSDRPDWANGNTSQNPHIKKNDESGTSRGGDYGDLYVLLRDENGKPEMIEIEGEWYVRPIDANGLPLELDLEGELLFPELATAVEFGRLNIVRSPQDVLDQAFEEAMKTLTAPNAVITLDFCGRLTSTYDLWSEGELTRYTKTIDSPRENMALYQYLLKWLFKPTDDGPNRLAFLGQEPYNFNPLDLATACLAAGSDKTGTITLDEMIYINGFANVWGVNPLVNENEYNFQGEQKLYFNFTDYDGMGATYTYNRMKTFKNRYIQFLVWNNVYYPIDENGVSASPAIFSIANYFETHGLFTKRWGTVESVDAAKGFALAADDA
uniref:membrane lipoprotein lipid attachment site-containing protein n=1 Tax=Marinilabilia sp. TaxID=2021252 RepID=UPI0025B9C417